MSSSSPAQPINLDMQGAEMRDVLHCVLIDEKTLKKQTHDKGPPFYGWH